MIGLRCILPRSCGNFNFTTGYVSAGLLRTEEAGAGLPYLGVQVSSVLKIGDGTRVSFQNALTSFEEGVTVERPADICTMNLTGVVDQGTKRANSSIWKVLLV